MKSRLNGWEKIIRNTLTKETIINCNWLWISDLNAFMLEASRIFLKWHGLPITTNTKYNTGSVVDTHRNKSSKCHAVSRWFLYREFQREKAEVCTQCWCSPYPCFLNTNMIYNIFTIIDTLQNIRCKISNTHCNYQIWLFVNILE